MTVIAIDGPAASGKGTLARRLAQHLNFAYLDTGSLYRAVGLQVKRMGGDVNNPADSLCAAQSLSQLDLNDPELKAESTGELASKVAQIPKVRACLLNYQHNFAKNPPNNKIGAILDGRDISTVVCPDSDIKLFITADVETRSKRRFLEQFGENGTDQDYNAILDDLRRRDERDINRTASPLKMAQNAHLLDTTNSDIDTVFEQALKLISDEIMIS